MNADEEQVWREQMTEVWHCRIGWVTAKPQAQGRMLREWNDYWRRQSIVPTIQGTPTVGPLIQLDPLCDMDFD